MKIVFMGTPAFASSTLAAIIEAGHEVVAVYTRAPKPAGRGKKLQESDVHRLASEYDIPVRTPNSLKASDVCDELLLTQADAIVVAAYGHIIPHIIIEHFLCLNVHASLLPRWRGAAPIQRAIMAGDDVTGVTIMRMDEGLDTGDMIISSEVQITQDTDAGQLHDALADVGASLMCKVLNDIDLGVNLTFDSQLNDSVTYADKISKKEACIDFAQPACVVECMVRAFSPFPGAYMNCNGERIKILAASIEMGYSIKPGQIVDKQFGIACKDGVLYPKRLQRAGKSVVDIDSFLNGFDVPVGDNVME